MNLPQSPEVGASKIPERRHSTRLVGLGFSALLACSLSTDNGEKPGLSTEEVADKIAAERYSACHLESVVDTHQDAPEDIALGPFKRTIVKVAISTEQNSKVAKLRYAHADPDDPVRWVPPYVMVRGTYKKQSGELGLSGSAYLSSYVAQVGQEPRNFDIYPKRSLNFNRVGTHAAIYVGGQATTEDNRGVKRRVVGGRYCGAIQLVKAEDGRNEWRAAPDAVLPPVTRVVDRPSD